MAKASYADYRVDAPCDLDLAERDPADKRAFRGDKGDAREEFEALNARLEALQELLFAEGRQRLLVVLQAMDTGGKDGVIRRVFDGVNPLGCRVASFKQPTPPELARDYLWRAHAQVPADGEIVLFNRSHYEDVLVVRVHEVVPEPRWRKRYDHIVDFERMLADEGTTILKFFLHISADEQRERLQARLDEPDKRWKFSAGDLAERKLWPEYQAAYAEAIGRTASRHAPWFIIPADRKWYRDLVVGRILVDTLEAMDPRVPEPPDLDGVVVE